GSAIGAIAGTIGIALLPPVDEAGGFLTGLGFTGFGWLLPLALPPIAAAVALLATRAAAFRKLRELT
ncbi:MAG: cell division protein FtsX, partial [Pseudomonadota bacterium]